MWIHCAKSSSPLIFPARKINYMAQSQTKFHLVPNASSYVASPCT
jgi:hypothetical protein